jgi:hypothetical protein
MGDQAERRNDLGAFVRGIIERREQSEAYVSPPRVLVAVDENLNSPVVWNSLTAVVSIGSRWPLAYEFHAAHAWVEIHELGGSRIQVGGGSKLGGKRVEGDSYPDRGVAALALAPLLSYQRVVVLTADRKKGPEEVRGILHREVRPVFETHPDADLGVHLVLKGRRTMLDEFALGVVRILLRAEFAPGFHERSV